MSKKLFVGGLAWATTEEGLKEAFAVYGKIVSLHIVMDRNTNKSRGFGFIEFSTEEEAQKALDNLNGSTLDNRKIHVRVSEPRPNRGKPGQKFKREGHTSRGNHRERREPREQREPRKPRSDSQPNRSGHQNNDRRNPKKKGTSEDSWGGFSGGGGGAPAPSWGDDGWGKEQRRRRSPKRKKKQYKKQNEWGDWDE